MHVCWQPAAAIVRHVHDAHMHVDNWDPDVYDADRDEAGWVCQERWEELRKLGQAGGWLVDHREVPLFSPCISTTPVMQVPLLYPPELSHLAGPFGQPPLSLSSFSLI